VTKAVALDITGETQTQPPAATADNGHAADATLTWTPEAEHRLARDKGLTVVTLETAEEAISMARQLMQESIGAYMQNAETAGRTARRPVGNSEA
jgi:hypothetical protein